MKSREICFFVFPCCTLKKEVMKMQVRLRDIISCIEDDRPRQQYWLSPIDGTITLEQQNGYLPLPDHEEINEYGNMQNFIDTLDEGTAREWLTNSIRGAGAFRRFRSTLQRFHLEDEWYDYDEACHKYLAIDWCERNGILYDESEPEMDEEDDWYDDEDEDDFTEEVKTPITETKPKTENYSLIRLDARNVSRVEYMIMNHTDELLALRGMPQQQDLEAAHEIAARAIENGDAVYAVSEHSRYVAYMILRLKEDGLVLEELYTRKEYRRKGIATHLFQKAEEDAKENHTDLLVFVMPENQTGLSFLSAQGYGKIAAYQMEKNL